MLSNAAPNRLYPVERRDSTTEETATGQKSARAGETSKMPNRLIDVSACLQTDLLTIDLTEHETESPCNLTYVEDRYVLIMQRQRLQTFSTGRFLHPDQQDEFDNIGRLLLLTPNVPLEVKAEGGMTHTVRCSFTPETLYKLTGRHELVRPHGMASCLDIKCPRVARLLAQLANEVENPGPNSEKLVDALGTAVVIELARWLDAHRREGGVSRGGLARRAFRQVIDYVNGNDGSATIGDLVSLTGYSERHLTRAFKETTGQTIHEYITEVRLKRAVELLSDTDLMVKDIAVRLGFGSSGSFCAAFARETGESPGEFRRRQQAIPRAIE